QLLLDLDGAQLVAPALDDVHAGAAENLHETIGRPARGIPRLEEARVERGQGGGRIAVVTLKHAAAPDPDLARLPRCDVSALLVDDADLRVGQWPPTAARLAAAVQRVADHDADLRHAVALQRVLTAQRLQTTAQLLWQLGAAA